MAFEPSDAGSSLISTREFTRTSLDPCSVIYRNNLKDVKLLTEIAHENRVGTDYHLNEPPQSFVNVDHYDHRDDMLSVTPDQYEEEDELLDWIIEKQRQGWPMVNSIDHLEAFKERMRGSMRPWDCRAGKNGALNVMNYT